MQSSMDVPTQKQSFRHHLHGVRNNPKRRYQRRNSKCPTMFRKILSPTELVSIHQDADDAINPFSTRELTQTNWCCRRSFHAKTRRLYPLSKLRSTIHEGSAHSSPSSTLLLLTQALCISADIASPKDPQGIESHH